MTDFRGKSSWFAITTWKLSVIAGLSRTHKLVGVFLLGSLCQAEVAFAERQPFYLSPISDEKTALSFQNGGRQTTIYAESHALLIGEVNYKFGWERLTQIPGEFLELASALEMHNFKVEVHFDLGSEHFLSTIDAFMRKYATREDTRVIVYVAGHGFSRNSFDPAVGYFIPVDNVKSDDPAEMARSAIQLDVFRYWAEIPDAKHVLFVFDACFSGAFFRYQNDGSLRRPIAGSVAANTPPPTSFGFGVDDYAISSRPMQKGRQFIAAGDSDEIAPSKSVVARLLARILRDQIKDAQSSFDRWFTARDIGLWLERHGSRYVDSAGNDRPAAEPLYGTLPSSFVQGNMVFDRTSSGSTSQNTASLFPVEKVVASLEFEDLSEAMSGGFSVGASSPVESSGNSLPEAVERLSAAVEQFQQLDDEQKLLADSAVTPANAALSKAQSENLAAIVRMLSIGNVRERLEARKALAQALTELPEPKKVLVVEKMLLDLSSKSDRYQLGVADAIAAQKEKVRVRDTAAAMKELQLTLELDVASPDPRLKRALEAAITNIK